EAVRRPHRRHIRQLAEVEIRADRAVEVPFLIPELGEQVRANLLERLRVVHRDRDATVHVVAFVGAEEEETIADDRPAEAHARLELVPLGLLRTDVVGVRRLAIVAALDREVVLGDQSVRLPDEEDLALPLVGPRLGRRADDGAGRLLVLRLVLLRNDAELLAARLRERMPLARVLPDDTAA